jgi:hypothetical protein
MKRRFAVYLSFSFLIALLLIGSATVTQIVRAGHSAADFDTWIFAQQSEPVLWLVDVAAISLVLMMFRAGVEVAHSQQQTSAYAELAAEQLRTQEDHHRQVEALIARNIQLEKHTTELEELNHERALRVGEMEMQIEDQQQRFDQEARRLTEQALRALEGQVNANTLQMEAVNMAMQYQRAELKELRHGLRAVQTSLEPAQVARLTPAEMAAISEHAQPAIAEQPAGLPDAPIPEAAPQAILEEPWQEEPLPPLALTTMYGEAAATGPLSPEDVPPLSAVAEPLAEEGRDTAAPTDAASMLHPQDTAESAADTSVPEETGSVDFTAPVTPPAFIFLLHDPHKPKTDEPPEAPLSAKEMLDAIPEVVPEEFAALRRAPQPLVTETPAAEETPPPPEKPEKPDSTTRAQAEAPAAPRDWHFKI